MLLLLLLCCCGLVGVSERKSSRKSGTKERVLGLFNLRVATPRASTFVLVFSRVRALLTKKGACSSSSSK